MPVLRLFAFRLASTAPNDCRHAMPLGTHDYRPAQVPLHIAAREDGDGIGRIRMRRIPDASVENLVSFVQDSVVTGQHRP